MHLQGDSELMFGAVVFYVSLSLVTALDPANDGDDIAQEFDHANAPPVSDAEYSQIYQEDGHRKAEGGYEDMRDDGISEKWRVKRGHAHRLTGTDAVRDANTLLRKIRTPTASRLARFSKPKGFMGTSVYYAKELFFLLFMNAPNTDPTISSKQPAKLAPPLAQAVRLLQQAAGDGNSDAIFMLAEMNFHGNFTHPRNYTEAFKWYNRLAHLDGNSTAQYMMGFMYATGIGGSVEPDQAKAMLYHTFAADQGNTRSEMTMAYRHHAGIATPRNCDEAVHYYRSVADKAIRYYKSGPPGGYSLIRDAYRLADEDGGVYGEGASVSSSGVHAKQGGPTSDAYADVEDVLEYLHFQSTKGDLKATFGLARLHYDGARGLKRDLKLAKKHFMLVARQYWDDRGKVRADVPQGTEKLASKAAGYLGRMFLRGEGMEQSYAKAKIWFTRGLANGDALSQYSMGLMYLHGLGVTKDVVKAADYFGPAADQDLAVAQTNLGILFLDQGDTATATRYFDFAARNSHIEAFFYLAEMNDQGIGRDRSCGLAALHYKIVAEKAEIVHSPFQEANEAYEEGDLQKALVAYMMAAEQGSENAQANVAYLLDQTRPRYSIPALVPQLFRKAKNVVGDAALALIYWTRSAKQQNIDSLVKMGDYYLDGIGAPKNLENAALCYQAAAETMLSAQAMWNLGWMHENGVGIEQDFHLAKRFYDQALETNSEAYLPVKMALLKLRARSWWNGITRGNIKGIQDEPSEKKSRSFSQWLSDFLEADAAYYAEQYEPDDWDATHEPMPGGDDFYDEEIDDGVFETLLILGLAAALAALVWYRQLRAAEQRRRQALQEQGMQQVLGQPAQAPQGEQHDRGLFPQPGDPAFNDWIAGGVGH